MLLAFKSGQIYTQLRDYLRVPFRFARVKVVAVVGNAQLSNSISDYCNVYYNIFIDCVEHTIMSR